MKKLLFIDTNVFINCVFQRTEDLNCEPLKEILRKLEKDELILIMPEIIENEIFLTLKSVASELKEEIEKYFKSISQEIKKKEGKVSKLIIDSIEEGKKSCLKKIEDANTEGLKLLKKIIKDKNTEKISMTNELLINGMKRAFYKGKKGLYYINESAFRMGYDLI